MCSNTRSSSDDDTLPKQLPAPATEGVHSSLRPKRTCKREQPVSSSIEEDVPKQHHSAPARKGVHSSAPLPATATFLEHRFTARDSSHAKLKLIDYFDENHAGGHIRCVNSRWNYVYLECKKCHAKCAATFDSHWWVVSKAPLPGHCIGVAPLVAASVHQSVSVQPVQPTISTSLRAISPPLASKVAPVLAEICECCMCFNPDVAVADATFCAPHNHAYCKECFSNHVKNLCEKRLDFMKEDCRVFCMKCRMDALEIEAEAFDMQIAVAKCAHILFDCYLYTLVYSHSPLIQASQRCVQFLHDGPRGKAGGRGVESKRCRTPCTASSGQGFNDSYEFFCSRSMSTL